LAKPEEMTAKQERLWLLGAGNMGGALLHR
jgi:hypothetical protein